MRHVHLRDVTPSRADCFPLQADARRRESGLRVRHVPAVDDAQPVNDVHAATVDLELPPVAEPQAEPQAEPPAEGVLDDEVLEARLLYETRASAERRLAVAGAENDKLTREAYDGMLAALREVMQSSPGFVAHMGWSTPEGWRVVEIWRTSADANQFFAKHVHPNLPPGAKPKRSVHELHALLEPMR